MKKYILTAPCHFGMEAVLKREIIDLGYEIDKVEDGRVSFIGDGEAIARANIFLRTAERIILQLGRFRAVTFEELFQNIKAIPWEEYLPKDSKFWVSKASIVNSKLYSAPDIQRIVKKAIVERLKEKYHINWFPETGAEYPIRIFNHKDVITVGIDTSGLTLHKRGYRQITSKAPISETLAAALIMLTPWNKNRILVDPFCGSGTFPIEAAMMAANIAPGMNREFTSEAWTDLVTKKNWYDAINEANDLIDDNVKVDIEGYDIDPKMIDAAKKNAEEAGVLHMIHFEQRPVKDIQHKGEYGFLITNPPYGERLEEKEALPELYQTIGKRYQMLDKWSAFIISSYENVERDMGLKATKNRKVYNGMLKSYYYQFMGPKPEKRRI